MRTSLFLCISFAVLVSGCIVVPLPHVTKRSPGLEGHVRDATTGQPIAGATVELVTHEGQARDYAMVGHDTRQGARVRTGDDGSFDIGPRYNFHLLWYANPSFHFHVPFGTFWLGESTISRDGYRSVSLHSSNELREVRLVPTP